MHRFRFSEVSSRLCHWCSWVQVSNEANNWSKSSNLRNLQTQGDSTEITSFIHLLHSAVTQPESYRLVSIETESYIAASYILQPYFTMKVEQSKQARHATLLQYADSRLDQTHDTPLCYSMLTTGWTKQHTRHCTLLQKTGRILTPEWTKQLTTTT